MNEIAYFTALHHGVPLSFEYPTPTRHRVEKPRRTRRKLRLRRLAPRRRTAIA